MVNNMKGRDAEIKAHEAAHMASGGGIARSSATYEYQSGPDGKWMPWDPAVLKFPR